MAAGQVAAGQVAAEQVAAGQVAAGQQERWQRGSGRGPASPTELIAGPSAPPGAAAVALSPSRPLALSPSRTLRNFGCDSATSTKTSRAERTSPSSLLLRASAMVCSISGTKSWNALRDPVSVSARRNDASALSAATRTSIAWSGCSEARKTSRRVAWYGTIFSEMNSEKALKIVSAASCMFTFPLFVAASMNGSSSGHADMFSESRLMPSWPTASHTFLRMLRCGSASMHASSSFFSVSATPGSSDLISESPLCDADCITAFRISTAHSERTCSLWLLRSIVISEAISALGLAFAWLNAASAWLRILLSFDISALIIISNCASVA